MNNQSSYCGLVDAKIKASDKDLPVKHHIVKIVMNISKDSRNAEYQAAKCQKFNY